MQTVASKARRFGILAAGMAALVTPAAAKAADSSANDGVSAPGARSR